MDPTRRALLEDAVRFYQDLLHGREDHPRTRFAVARAYSRLSQIHAWFRDLEKMKRCQDQAIALLGELLAEDSRHEEYRRLEAYLFSQRAWLRWSSRQFPGAEADYRRSLEVLEGLSAERPDRPEFARERADTHRRLGNLLHETVSATGSGGGPPNGRRTDREPSELGTPTVRTIGRGPRQFLQCSGKYREPGGKRSAETAGPGVLRTMRSGQPGTAPATQPGEVFGGTSAFAGPRACHAGEGGEDV